MNQPVSDAALNIVADLEQAFGRITPVGMRGRVSKAVGMLIDASGILQVRARDAQTGQEQRVTLDLVGAMPQADVGAARDRIQQLRR